MQSIMLLCEEAGLSTCAQEAWAEHHGTVAKHCGIPEEEILFAGLAVGYQDKAHPLNTFRPAKAELHEFVKFVGNQPSKL